jgi:YggT family protein
MHLVGLLSAAITVYMVIIFVRVLFSWLPAEHRANDFYRFLRAITEPILGPLSRIIPPVGGLDLSPIVALLLLQVLKTLIAR